MRGEAGIVKKKLQTLAKDSEDHKSSIGKMTAENQVFICLFLTNH